VKCGRCGGNGKFYLFSSKEDPCTDCGGTGIDSGSDPVEAEDDPVASIDDFFRAEVGRSPRPDEVHGSPLRAHPTKTELRDLIDDFESKFVAHAKNYGPLRLVKSPLPMIHYRRAQGHSLTFPIGKGFYPSRSSWNTVKGDDQPCDSLIMLSILPFPLAVYFQW